MSILQYYQTGNLVLPSALFFHYRDLFEQADDFVVWQFCYLHNTSNLGPALIEQMAEALGKSTKDINASLSRLMQQNLLVPKNIEVAGGSDLVFDALPALEKLERLLGAGQVATESKQPPVPTNPLKALVADFERELGRLLSPFELEDLQKLVTDHQTDPDLVREALKEAVFNGKTNWSYIQAILRNWRKEGIITLRQVAERRQEREGQQAPGQLVMDDSFRQALTLFQD